MLLLCLVVATLAADKYNAKYDNFDVDTLIANDRLLKAYINCFLDKGRCTPEGTDFKSKFVWNFKITFIINLKSKLQLYKIVASLTNYQLIDSEGNILGS